MYSLFTYCGTRLSTKGKGSGSRTNPLAQYQPRSLVGLSLPMSSTLDLQVWWLPWCSVYVRLGSGWQSPAGRDPAISVLPVREELLKGCHLHSTPHKPVTFTHYPSLFSIVV